MTARRRDVRIADTEEEPDRRDERRARYERSRVIGEVGVSVREVAVLPSGRHARSLSQLEAVFGAFTQKCQQGVADAHQTTQFVIILSIVLDISLGV